MKSYHYIAVLALFFLFGIGWPKLVLSQSVVDFNTMPGNYGYGATFGDNNPAPEPGEPSEVDMAGGFLFTVSGNMSNPIVRGNRGGNGYSGTHCLRDNSDATGAITRWSIKRADGSNFRFMGIYLLRMYPDSSPSGAVIALKNGTEVGRVDHVDFDGTLLYQTFANNPVFYDVDEIRIEAPDINICLDHFMHDVPLVIGANDPAQITSISLVGNPITTATTVTYTITFSKPAYHVDISDFELTTTQSATANLASVTGSNGSTTYTAVINNIAGEGSLRLDLKADNDIENEDEVGGTAAFASGQTHYVSSCFTETFDVGETHGTATFSGNGKTFTLGGNWTVHTEIGTGLGGSASNLKNTGTGPYTIASDDGVIAVAGLYLYLSSHTDGSEPTDNGTVTIRGLRAGDVVYSFDKTSGFATDHSPHSGYTYIDFSAEGGENHADKLIDQLEISIGGNFVYLNLDNFSWCLDFTPPSGYTVRIDQDPITPANEALVSFTFSDAEVGATYDYTLTSTGGGTAVIGSGTVSTATQQVTGIDLSGLAPGTVSLSVTLTDESGNTGIAMSSTAEKTENNLITPGDPGNFVTTWQVEAGDLSITIPTHGDETYNYNIYWENTANSAQNGILTGQTGNATLTFSVEGSYRVEINGDFPRIYINDEGDKDKIRAVEQWGSISWTSMERAFFKAGNMQLHASDAPDLSNVTSLREMFYGVEQLNAPVGHWDVSTITDMHGLFRDAVVFNQDLSNWDVSNVTDMSRMFWWGTEFNGNVTNWDVSAVKDMSYMFGLNRNFDRDISGWDVGQVEDMRAMFFGAWAFSHDISGWDVSHVENMQDLLYEARAFDYNLGDWDITNVSNMHDMLLESGLSMDNYDATLQGWANHANVPANVTLGAKDLTFCAGAEARQALIDEHGWIITGDAPACASMLLFVETEVGNTLIVLSEGSDAIQQVKQKIQDKAGFAPNQQQLFFEGLELEDGRTLTDYGIVNGNTLHLTLNIPITPGVGNTLYVNQNVSGGNGSGDSWANAIAELADALKWAREQYNDDNTVFDDESLQIHVAKGTYKPLYELADKDDQGDPTTERDRSFLLVKNVQLYGGFADSGNPTLNDRDWNTHETILSGELQDDGDMTNNAHHVVVSAGEVGNALLDGFTVTGSNSNMHNVGTIRVNGEYLYRMFGGGMLTHNSSPQLTNMVVTGNRTEFGGGMFNASSSPKLTNVIISGNTVNNFGGAMYNSHSSPTLTNVAISGNTAALDGGGIYNFQASPELTNVAVTGNTANRNGGGIFHFSGEGILTNTTIAGNSPNAIFANDRIRWNNTIVWGEIDGSDYEANNSLTQGNSDTGNGNIDATGLSEGDVFNDPANGDYSLKDGGPAVNVGDNTLYDDAGGDLENDTDLAGHLRVFQETIDIGAYESQVLVNVPPVVTTSGGSTTFTEVLGHIPGPVVVDPDVLVSDPDHTTLSWATVSISTGFQSGEDVLAFENDGNMGNINGAYDSDTGVLTLTSQDAEATLAQWQAALRAVTYSNTSKAPNTDDRTITFVVNDGADDGIPTTKTVVVDDVNDPPMITAPASIQVTENEYTELTGISFSDVDAGVGSVEVTFSVPGNQGQLQATVMVGIALTLIEHHTVALEGTLENINHYMANGYLRFRNMPEVLADIPLSIAINDQGNTGNGGAQTDNGEITITINTTVPRIVQVYSSDPDGYYGEGSSLDIHVEFDREITVTDAGDGIHLQLATGVPGRSANYVSGSGSETLVFQYTVQPGDESLHLDYLNTGALELATGSSIESVEAGISADLTLPDPGAVESLSGSNELVVDGIAPTALAMDMTLELDANGVATLLPDDLNEGSSDNLTPEGNLLFVVSQTDFDCSDIGSVEVTFTVTDEAGNEASATATVTVVDVTDPTVLTRNLIVALDTDGMTTITPEMVDDGSDDACGIATLALSKTTFNRDDLGENTLTLTATDHSGNQSDATATVVVIAFDNASFTYDGTEKTLAIAGTLPDGATVSYNNNGRTEAGTQTVTANIDGGDNYKSFSRTAQLEIIRADISDISFDDDSFVYDGTEKTLTIAGRLPDGATVSYTNNGRTEAGTQTVTANIDGGDNYNSFSRTAQLEITKASLVDVIAFDDDSFVYDGTEKTLSIAGRLPDEATVSYTNNGRTESGTQTVTANIDGGDNYNSFSRTAQLEITKANITGIDFLDDSFVYDGTEKTLSIAGRLPDGAKVSYTGNGRTEAGTQIVTANIDGGDNYNGFSRTAQLTIERARLTVSADSHSKLYGSVDPELGYTVTGLMGQDREEDVLNGTLVRTAGENVGDHTIQQGTLSSTDNYHILFSEGVLSIFSGVDISPALPGAVTIGSGQESVIEILLTNTWTADYQEDQEIALGADAGQGFIIEGVESESFAITRQNGRWILRPNRNWESGEQRTLTILTVGDGRYVGSSTLDLEVWNPLNVTLSGDQGYTVKIHVEDGAYTITPNNVFTPNGDGINDTFVFPGLELHDRAELTVLNRFGDQIYYNADYKNDWTAHNVQDGTYYYVLWVWRYDHIQQRTVRSFFKGSVLVKRN